jgi:hypothetical protein
MLIDCILFFPSTSIHQSILSLSRLGVCVCLHKKMKSRKKAFAASPHLRLFVAGEEGTERLLGVFEVRHFHQNCKISSAQASLPLLLGRVTVTPAR